MKLADFFKKNWIHFAAIGIFLLVSMIYFSLQMQGYGLKQHDVEQYIGSSHEIQDFREHNNGQEPLWTNSMFGGMPANQISMIHGGNIFSKTLLGYLRLINPPMGIVLLYMLGLYILFTLLRVNQWLSIFGAIALSFLSYNVFILQAGHNTKGLAIAFMAPVIGAFIVALRRNWKLGALLSAVFMAFEMAANHLQITYYLGFILLFLGITELVSSVKAKRLPEFMKGAAGLFVGYLLAFLINAGNIVGTNDYAKHTIRGGNDITIAADGKSNSSNSTSGLDRDYVVQYSYGKDESFTLISPYIKGGGSMPFAMSPFTETIENSDLNPAQQNTVNQSMAYWGNQPSVSGPVYIGVILAFLALLGLVYLNDPSKWALFGVSVLALLLAWGKNYMGLTNWFLDHVPGYDKFRAVTIIMVVIELCIPVLGILFLDKLIKEREAIKAKIKPFYITSGAFLLLLIAVRFAGIDKVYLSERERDPGYRAQQEQSIYEQIMKEDPETLKANGIDVNDPNSIKMIIDNNMKSFDDQQAAIQVVRKDVFNASMNRSIGFTLVAALILLLFFKTQIASLYIVLGVSALGFIDVVAVTRNYLSNEEEGSGYRYWSPKFETMYPMVPSSAEVQILENELNQNPKLKAFIDAGTREGRQKALDLGADGLDARRIESAYTYAALNRNTNFRVFDYSGAFNSARASYFNKSIGGYHGAKLRSIQNLAEFHIYKSNNKVLDMLNVKYLIQPVNGDLQANPNPNALGNAWFVSELKAKQTPNDELLALGSRISLQNIGTGKLLVNGVSKQNANAFGSEKLQYVPNGERDTLDIPLSNGMEKGVEVVFVRDVNGKTNLILKQGFDLDTSKSFSGFVAIKVAEDFNPKTAAIISVSDKAGIGNLNYDGKGEIKETSYAPNKLVYHVNTAKEGFAVFSEIYYPYWKATVKGKEVPVYRVNYLLRGLKLPQGEYDVVFEYVDPVYSKFNTISGVVSAILIALILVYIGFMNINLFKKKSEVETK